MSKIRLLFYFFLIGFSCIIVKLFYIQVLAASEYSADYISTFTISPERGKILDRNGDPLAVNQTKYLLFAEPQNLDKKDTVIQQIDSVIQLGEATIASRIDPKKRWVAIKDNLSEEAKLSLEKMKIKGLGFQPENKRYYPEASLAAHLIGFLGKNDKGENVGYSGVEGYYNKDLAGLPGVLKSERDLFGKAIFVGTQDRVDAENGRDFTLTIDKTVQHLIKDKLKKGVERYKAKSGCVIAADPMTMEIIGLACLPDFDPEHYYDFESKDFSNWAISSVYEPGSTWKPTMVAAALEEKVYKPLDTFEEACQKEVGGYTIKNWDNKCEGRISINRILEKSSNIGMVYTGEKLGNDRVYSYLKKYGIGEYTDIDLEGEVPGILRPQNQFYPIDYATATFGQGMAVTPIQLVRSFAALINGGKLMRPYVVKEVTEDGYKRSREPKVVRRVISEHTSAIMRKMLVSVVDHAEVKWNKPDGYTFGGKTGTAQIALQGAYDSSKTIASFIGFAPADQPKFVMLVVLKEPGVSSWGSETAAPIFFDIAKDLLVYYNIPPTASPN